MIKNYTNTLCHFGNYNPVTNVLKVSLYTKPLCEYMWNSGKPVRSVYKDVAVCDAESGKELPEESLQYTKGAAEHFWRCMETLLGDCEDGAHLKIKVPLWALAELIDMFQKKCFGGMAIPVTDGDLLAAYSLYVAHWEGSDADEELLKMVATKHTFVDTVDFDSIPDGVEIHENDYAYVLVSVPEIFWGLYRMLKTCKVQLML